MRSGVPPDAGKAQESLLEAVVVILESDYDNFRAAMAWARGSGWGETALRIAAALCWFWIYHRHVNDGQDWLERAVLHSEDAPPTLRAVVLARAAVLHAKKLRGFDRLNGWLDESLRLCQQAGSPEGMAEVLFMAAWVAWFEGEFERALEHAEKAWPVLERTDHTADMASARFVQGSVAGSRGDDHQATVLLEQALALARELGGHWGMAYLIVALGGRALDQADYDRAQSLYEESLPLFRNLNDITGVACALTGLGNVAWLQGDQEKALELHSESLAMFRDSREGSSIAFCLSCLAGDVRPSDGLLGLVERHNQRLDLSPEVWSKSIIADTLHRAGTAAERRGDLERADQLLLKSQLVAHETETNRK